MENYIVSARKYRPSTFASVVGQKALTTTLRNSISKNRLAHAYLFTGSRGVGKTSCARIFAKTINCRNRTPQGEACNECESCREFNRGSSLNIVELDAASNNGVDAMRNLTEQVQVPPVNADYRVFIVDEVHMLSSAAFNAFLKTLEEPPSYVIFILATTEKHKIIPTILSRCQIYDFSRITIQDMVDHLAYVASQEGITTEPAALNVIARKADGAMRDALSIFDQVAASTMGNVTYAATIENLNILDFEYYNRLTEAFLAGDVPTALLIYKEIREKGFDSQFFINGLAQHFRDLMVAANPQTIGLLEASDDVRQSMAAVASKCEPKFLYMAMDLCNQADLNYRSASNKQFLVELTLIKLCQPDGLSHSDDGAREGQLSPIASVGPAPQPESFSPGSAAAAAAQHQPATKTAGSVILPPEPQPRATTSSRTPRMRRISINDPETAAPTASAADSSQKQEKRSEPFDDEVLAKAWQEFIDTHPKAHLLCNAMRNAHLTRTEGATFTATVESEAIRDSIEGVRQTLLDSLRDTLSNDFFNLVVVLDKGESSIAAMTESEVYALMRQKHPYLNTLAADLHLTLI